MILAFQLWACTAGKGTATGVTPTTTATTAATATTVGTTASTGTTPAPPAEVLVNEFMAANAWSTYDELGNPSDWIELYNAGEAEVLLDGWSLTDDFEDPARHVLAGGLRIAPGGFLLLWADGAPDLGPTHLDFRLDAEGEAIGLYDADGVARDLLVYGVQATDVAASRLPDGSPDWTFTYGGTPGASNREVVLERTDLVPELSVWSYWDEGEPPEKGWNLPGYDDSAWGSGPGVLGYGDAQATEVGYGSNPSRKYVTTWFRHAFTVPEDVVVDRLVLSLLVDDGAIVTLNGVEAHRRNMPDGPVDEDTLASATVSGADETTWFEVDIDPSLVVPGENVLAAEVHQASPTSSDISFDAGLHAETRVLVDP